MAAPDLTSTRIKVALALDEADAALGQPTVGQQLAAATAARDQAVSERDQAVIDRDAARADATAALGERDAARNDKARALAKLQSDKASDALSDTDRDAAIAILGG